MKKFDLDNFESLASEEGAWMDVCDPATGEPVLNDAGKPVRIRLVGVDSPRYRAKQHEYMNRRLSKMKVNLGTAAQMEADGLDLVTACTVGWEGMIKGGKPWDYSPANARALYATPALRFIKEQADTFIGERSNFLPK